MTAASTATNGAAGDIYPKFSGQADRVSLRLNEHGWRLLLGDRNISSDGMLSNMLGLTASSIWRVRKGENNPSGKFVASALHMFNKTRPEGAPLVSFYDVFDIVVDETADDEAQDETDAA